MSVSAIEIHEVNSVPLVFGLDWFAVIGSDARHEALKIARKYKASHISVASKHTASVGMTNITIKNFKKKNLYCAAQIMASNWPQGTVALLMQIDNGNWWLLALHDGAIIARTDFLCASRQQALNVINDLHETYPELTVIDSRQQDIDLSDCLSKGYEHTVLQPVRPIVLLIKAYWYVVVMLLLTFILLVYALRPNNIQEPDVGLVTGPSAVSAWEQALLQATKNYWVHGVQSTTIALQNFYKLPLVIGGWQLLRAECVPNQMMWLCTANYSRSHMHASNLTFLEHAPQDWQPEFVPLDQVSVSWAIDSLAERLSNLTLNKQEANQHNLFSRWQNIKPALAGISISLPQQLPVNTPLDEKGLPIPRPDRLPVFTQRILEIRSPLRSASLILPNTEHISWQRIFINVLPVRKPSLLESQLNITLQGVLYEQS